MATFIIRTTMRPTEDIEVDAAEYERLLDLGLVLNAPADPAPIDHFDTEIAATINDHTSDTYAAGLAAFGMFASSTPPASPVLNQIWIS